MDPARRRAEADEWQDQWGRQGELHHNYQLRYPRA